MSVDELARCHWRYVEELLRTHGAPPENLVIYKFHYISAFIHGYKHAMEDAAK